MHEKQSDYLCSYCGGRHCCPHAPINEYTLTTTSGEDIRYAAHSYGEAVRLAISDGHNIRNSEKE